MHVMEYLWLVEHVLVWRLAIGGEYSLGEYCDVCMHVGVICRVKVDAWNVYWIFNKIDVCGLRF